MELKGNAALLRIFVGERDKVNHQPLYEAILFAARKQGIAGCTVIKGIMSYGAGTIVHTAKFIEISQDLPIVIELIDEEQKINEFITTADKMMDEAACGGLITIEKVSVLYYKHKSK